MPWLGLFAKLAACDSWLVWDEVQYTPKEFVNRNRIDGPNGPFWLTVPVARTDRSTKIREVKVSDSDFGKKHLKALVNSYGKAPFFEEFFPAVQEIYARKDQYLLDIDLAWLNLGSSLFKIERPIRLLSSLGLESSKSDLVLEATPEMGGTGFLFGPLGRDYVDREAFALAGVKPCFHDFRGSPYRCKRDSRPPLSFLDDLFRNGLDTCKEHIFSKLNKVHVK